MTESHCNIAVSRSGGKKELRRDLTLSLLSWHLTYVFMYMDTDMEGHKHWDRHTNTHTYMLSQWCPKRHFVVEALMVVLFSVNTCK